MTLSIRAFTLLFILIALTALTAQAQSPVTQLVIRHIEATTESGQARVKAYVAALNSDGQPVTGLTANDFTVTENNTSIPPNSLTVALALNPITITLLIDTSSQMTQPGSDGIRMIDAARDAAIKFIDSLKEGDSAAVYEYNTQVQTVQEAVVDHNRVINQSLTLNAHEVAEACLPKALSDVFNRLPTSLPGQHLIIVITGSPDAPAEACDGKIIDDVLGTLTTSAGRVPIFSIGLGSKVNQENLIRLSRFTGGQNLTVADAPAAAAAIMTIETQLRQQYEISYLTQAVGLGKVMIAETGSGQSDSRQVLVPEVIPPTSTPLPPFEITSIDINLDKDKLKIKIVVPNDVTLAKTELWVDGDPIHRNDVPPFEQFELDLAQLGSGKHIIGVEAVAENGVTAQTEREVNLEIPSTPVATPVLTPTPQATPAVAASGLFSSNGFLLPLLFIGVGALLLIVVIGLIIYFVQTGKPQPTTPPVNRPLAPPPPMITTDYGDTPDAEKTHDPYEEIAPAIKARLVVVAGSQLVSQPNFDLYKAETTLGRNTQKDINDIPLQDHEVSRSHAKIFYRERQFFIQDIGSSTGIRINGGNKISPFQDTLLQHNDEITLGPNIKFKLEIPSDGKKSDKTQGDDVTKDEDPDETLYRHTREKE